MFKKLFLFLAILSVLASCSTDFKVGADYKDITAVYCLLSKSDTAHYVKITKGFYDEKLDNLILAKNSDSIYYNNLEVKIEELNNGNVANTFVLNRVDLEKEGYPKNPGIFSDTPNYAYKLAQVLNPQRTYRLRIKNLTSGKEISGETNIIDNNPNIFSISNPFTKFDKLNFADATKSYTFSWNGPANAVFFDVVIRFWYQEKNTNNNIVSRKYADVPLLRNVDATGGTLTVSMSNKRFYESLAASLGAAPSNIVRLVDTPDLKIMAGGQVLKTYIDVNSAQGGITFDQIKPVYTNLSGEDVMGILSTRVTRSMDSIAFTESTFDSIIGGQYTRNLNFIGRSTE